MFSHTGIKLLIIALIYFFNKMERTYSPFDDFKVDFTEYLEEKSW